VEFHNYEILLCEVDLTRNTSCLWCSQNRLRRNDFATIQCAAYGTNMFYNGSKSLSFDECVLIFFLSQTSALSLEIVLAMRINSESCYLRIS